MQAGHQQQSTHVVHSLARLGVRVALRHLSLGDDRFVLGADRRAQLEALADPARTATLDGWIEAWIAEERAAFIAALTQAAGKRGTAYAAELTEDERAAIDRLGDAVIEFADAFRGCHATLAGVGLAQLRQKINKEQGYGIRRRGDGVIRVPVYDRAADDSPSAAARAKHQAIRQAGGDYDPPK